MNEPQGKNITIRRYLIAREKLHVIRPGPSVIKLFTSVIYEFFEISSSVFPLQTFPA
jgi:hypothetical protein